MSLLRKIRNRLLGLNHVVFSEKIECQYNSIMPFIRKFTKRLFGLNSVVVSDRIENLIA